MHAAALDADDLVVPSKDDFDTRSGYSRFGRAIERTADSFLENAYNVDFTQGGGDGARPIVLSYASSPPFTVPEGEDEPTTTGVPPQYFASLSTSHAPLSAP